MFKTVIFVAALLALTAGGLSAPKKIASPEAPSVEPRILAPADPNIGEKETVEYQRSLEERKLKVELYKAAINAISIVVPIVLGIVTLYWQSSSASKLKEREAQANFELKAAEIVFSSDNTRATKNKARALAFLFPVRLPPDFGSAFEPENFGGPRFDAKLEVFKAACGKVQSVTEVYEIWRGLFPGDKWINSLLEDSSLDPDSSQYWGA